MEVVIFGIHLTLNNVAFTIPIGNGWKVYWYGIIIAAGFLLALIYGLRNADRFNINKDRMLDVVLVTTPVAILCARAYYVIFDGEKLTSFGDFFGFGDSSGFSGIAIYGAVIGAAICGVFMCKIRKVKIFDMLDLAALGFLIGQGVGRWGNFVNQEAFGTLTGSDFWGMSSINTVKECGEGLVHPCFLYESLWCILGFVLLHILSKKRHFSGEIALGYCSWYGFGRGFIELLRTDSLMLGPVRVSSLLSFVICIAGLSAIILIRKREKAVLTDDGYVSQFASNAEKISEIEEANNDKETDDLQIEEKEDEDGNQDN